MDVVAGVYAACGYAPRLVCEGQARVDAGRKSVTMWSSRSGGLAAEETAEMMLESPGT